MAIRYRSVVWLCLAFWVFPCGAQELNFEGGLDPLPVITAELELASTTESVWSKLQLSGYLKNETAYRLREPRSITKIRNIAYLNAKYPLREDYDFVFSGWAYHDLAYDLFNYETIAARLERNSEEPLAFVGNLAQEEDNSVVDILELYVDVASERWDARLGKQYIVWGVLEGVRIVDEVNPMDFRELILLDLLDYRIPLWSAKLDYYSDYGDVELIVIPELRFHKPAPAGSEWELLQEVPGTREPESWRLENTEFGVKWGTSLLETELSLSYFYTWDDFPIIFRTIKVDGTVPPEFYPTYARMSMYGLTAVRQAGAAILKGEIVYAKGKFFGLSNVADSDGDGYVDTNGEAQKDHIRWGMGVDMVLLGWDTSVGVTQWQILDYESGIIQEKADTSYNVFLRREFPERSMTAQILWLYLQTLNETILKPKLFIQVTNRFQIAVGMDIFDGEKSDFGVGSAAQGQFNPNIQQAQFLGNFHNNDRVFFEFKYSY